MRPTLRKGLALCLACAAVGCRQPTRAPVLPPPESDPVVSNGQFAFVLDSRAMPKGLIVRGSAVEKGRDGMVRSAAPSGPTPFMSPALPEFPVRGRGSTMGGSFESSGVIGQITWHPEPESGVIEERVTLRSRAPLSVRWAKPSASDLLVWESPPKDVPVESPGNYQWVIRWRLRDGVGTGARGDVPSLKIEGPQDDRKVVEAALGRLSTEVRGGALGPFGATSEKFSDRMFWDSDVYWLPALTFLDPVAARTIAQRRVAQMPGAASNFKAWLAAGRPIAGGRKLGAPGSAVAASGLMFGWEADRMGHELSTAPTRFAHHGPGAVAWGIDFAAAAGLVGREQRDAVVRGVAEFYRSRLERLDDGKLHLRATVSPDEWRTGDDDLYTQCLARRILELAGDPAAKEVALPHEAGAIANNFGEQPRSIQQASALLAVFPLQDVEAEAKAGRLFDLYSDRVSDDGPNMSYGIHAVVAARMGRAEEAYMQWKAGWSRFSDHPEWEMREKPGVASGYFLTGGASQLNGVVYGFLGLRVDVRQPANASWSKKLRSGAWVSLTPRLPAEWKSIRAKLWFDGLAYEVAATGKSVEVKRT